MEETELGFKIQLNDDQEPKQINSQQKYEYNQNYQEQSSNNGVQKSQESLSIAGSNYDLKKASHPSACVFTFLFKLLALITYLFMGVLLNNITIYILVVIFTALDFWTVKNVTGRLLVGLKWTSTYKDDGSEEWSFESNENLSNQNSIDGAFFWSSQIGALAIWGLFVFVNVLSFSIYWASLNSIVCVLTGTNFYGFYKCRGEHQKKMNGVKDQITQKGMNFIGNMMMKRQFGFNQEQI